LSIQVSAVCSTWAKQLSLTMQVNWHAGTTSYMLHHLP
jgi:hypothetical protein